MNELRRIILSLSLSLSLRPLITGTSYANSICNIAKSNLVLSLIDIYIENAKLKYF